MLDITTGHNWDCEGFSRRQFVKVGTLAAAGLTLADYFRLSDAEARSGAKAQACIYLWMSGGPAHIDTLDPKPEAPAEIHGPWGAIETNVPGIRIGEHLPIMAKHADKYAIVRTMTHSDGAHAGAHDYVMTGRKGQPFQPPGLGSLAAMEFGFEGTLPPYMMIPASGGFSHYLKTYAESGDMSRIYAPFRVTGDPAKSGFGMKDVAAPEGISAARLGRRRTLLNMVDRLFREMDESDLVTSFDSFYQRAYNLISSPEAKPAFDLSKEPDSLRDAYGRTEFGQSCLLARRLVEHGTKFVTVNHGWWDTHNSNFEAIKNELAPSMEHGFTTLVKDLESRGLLDTTLIVLMGEFGRTPKINKWGARDHWPGAGWAVFAGAGVRGGQVIGETDAKGERPKERPVSPGDIARTIFEKLGINSDAVYELPGGRRTTILDDGEAISELM